jgi:hypothetical protein
MFTIQCSSFFRLIGAFLLLNFLQAAEAQSYEIDRTDFGLVTDGDFPEGFPGTIQ